MSPPKPSVQSPLQFKKPPFPYIQAPSQQPILIRRAHLFESHHIGRIASRTYYHTPLSCYLSPHRATYYADYEFGFTTRAQARMFSPRNVTYFAYEKGRPEEPVGYMQFVRMGDDGFANQLDRKWGVTWKFWVWVVSWAWGVYVKARLWWDGGNRSEDPEAVKRYMRMVEEEDRMHWQGREERKNRWHAQSVVVLEEYHGRGIGKRLMAEVLGRADSEGVVTGLEASREGEWMYRSVGFELLARFMEGNNFEGDGGGVMIRYPKEKKADVKE